MLTVRQALQQGTDILDRAGVGVPRLTAEVLLCHALRREKAWLYAHGDDELTELAWIHYGRYLHERSKGKPTQYITKRQEFYGREFRVTPAVLIPRPETEHLVETALELAEDAGRVVDIGCGSGIVGITWKLERGGMVVCTDLSEAAIEVTRGNAAALGAEVGAVRCDLGSALASGVFDLVLSNPPYVAEGAELAREVRDWEPALALFAGPAGLDVYPRLIGDAARLLRPGGWLIMELGFDSEPGVRGMMDGRWSEVEVRKDLAGWPRVFAARRGGHA